MLTVTNLGFRYSSKKSVLENFSFSLPQGAHLSVMGESGSGKSTLLKLLYGLLDASEGTISWYNEAVLGPAFHLIPGHPSFKYVAQDFDLMPYTTVAENIGAFLSNFYPEEKARRTEELLEVMGMTSFASTKVKNLSGGQQQRVAIAKALAKEPELLLLDEPFSQIDNFKKNALRRRLFAYLKKKNISCIVATHEGDDALSFADQLLVIKDNRMFALGNPQDIYHSPTSSYIASLFDDVNRLLLTIQGKNQTVLLYPHEIQINDSSPYQGVVVASYFKGRYWLLNIDFKGQQVLVCHHKSIPEGSVICFSVDDSLVLSRIVG